MRKRQKAKRQQQQQAYNTYRAPSSLMYQQSQPQAPSYEDIIPRAPYQPTEPIITDPKPIDEKIGRLSFCPSCGIQITDNGKFCTNCGGKL